MYAKYHQPPRSNDYFQVNFWQMRNFDISMVGRSTYNWLYFRYWLSALLTLPNAMYQPLCSRIENNQHITVVTIFASVAIIPQLACIHVIIATMQWYIFCLGSRHSVDLRIFNGSISTSFLHPTAKLFFPSRLISAISWKPVGISLNLFQIVVSNLGNPICRYKSDDGAAKNVARIN